jgi:hypothetical protein
LQPLWIVLIVSPDELDARIACGGAAASMSAKSLILKSVRSGPFSCTKSAPETAFRRSSVNSRRWRDAFSASPIRSSAFQAPST